MVRIGADIDRDLWETFREDVRERRGTVHGTLSDELENAIRQYLGKDELSRLEGRMASLEETVQEEVVPALHEENQKKKRADASPSRNVLSKLDRIKDRIRAEYPDLKTVTEREVEEIVEEIAGASEPTLRKYKQLLQEMRILFPHPTSEDRLLNLEEACDFVATMKRARKEKRLSPERYNELVEGYGRDWWAEQWEEVSDEWKRNHGFEVETDDADPMVG